jgi:hypothetical protein
MRPLRQLHVSVSEDRPDKLIQASDMLEIHTEREIEFLLRAALIELVVDLIIYESRTIHSLALGRRVELEECKLTGTAGQAARPLLSKAKIVSCRGLVRAPEACAAWRDASKAHVRH